MTRSFITAIACAGLFGEIHLSIRTKLVLAIAPILFISLVVTGTLVVSGSRDAIQSATVDRLQGIATTQKKRIEQITEQEFRILSSLSSRWKLRNALYSFNAGQEREENQVVMTKILDAARVNDAMLWDLSIVDLNGKVIASTDSEIAGDNLSAYIDLRTAKKQQTLGEFFTTKSQEKGVYLAGPLRLNDETIGVLAVVVDATTYTNPTQDRSGLGKTGEVVLARTTAQGVPRYIAPLRFTPNSALENISDNLALNSPTGNALQEREALYTDLTDYRGSRVYAVTKYIPSTRFAIVVKIDEAEVFELINRNTRFYLAGFAALLILQVIAILWVSNNITRPLRKLTDATEELGNLSSTQDETQDSSEPRTYLASLPKIEANDEVGVLATTLSEMIDKLNNAVHLEAEKRLAEQSNKAKSQFLANVSHEIRTPMNSIIGFIKLTLESKHLPDAIRIYLEIAHRSAISLIDLVNNVLDFSKYDSRQINFESISFNLRTLLEDCFALHHLAAKDKGLALNLNYDSSVPTVFKGDPTKLNQVFSNLISNAIKFTLSGQVDLDVRQDGSSIHFTVRDTGVGISEDKLDSVFQSFTQTDASITRKFGGTGLGTTICKQIVDQLDGKIWVESKVGEGSQFHVVLDLPLGSAIEKTDVEHEEKKEVSNNEPKTTDKPLSVLLAEDVEVNVMLCQIRLEQRGHRVTVAWNGKEAVEALKRESFDVVLMDIQMPVMDGLEAAQLIRAGETAGQHTPIIALSASVLFEDQKASLEAGMDRFLTKPVDFDELFRVMEPLAELHSSR